MKAPGRQMPHGDGRVKDPYADNREPRKGHQGKVTCGFCSRCNAWRGVFGLEPTPELYLEHTGLIFREAWRVLRKDGTLWVNLGDSYYGAGTSGGTAAYERNGSFSTRGATGAKPKRVAGLKAGDLCGIPWRVALALQADGWTLRRDNIWFKDNPMPESVRGWTWEQCRIKTKAQTQGSKGSVGNSKRTRDMSNGEYLGSAEYVDCPGCEKCAPNGGLILRKGNWRCTTSHEYVFQFAKSSSYFCDAEAARERVTGGAHSRGHGVNPKAEAVVKGRKRSKNRSKQNSSFSAAVSGVIRGNRNLRSVWRIPTKPYRGAHFATFPPDLVRPIVLAASPVKCCGKCGAPHAPVVERGEPRREQQLACGSDGNGKYSGKATKDFALAGAEDASAVKARILAGMVEKKVVGHRPTCRCNAEAVAATVLDMFGGSGTVGQVAHEAGRDAILIELSKEYIPLIEKRCAVTAGLGI